MKLKEYLDRFCILPCHLARKMNFAPNVIYRIMREGMLPSLKITLSIEDFTENRVTARDIYNECMEIKQKKEKAKPEKLTKKQTPKPPKQA